MRTILSTIACSLCDEGREGGSVAFGWATANRSW